MSDERLRGLIDALLALDERRFDAVAWIIVQDIRAALSDPRPDSGIDDAALTAFLDDLYQRGVDTAPEIRAALERAGYRIVVARSTPETSDA